MKRSSLLLVVVAALALSATTGIASAAGPFTGSPAANPLIKPLYTEGQAENRAAEWARYDWKDGRAYTEACYPTGKNQRYVTQWECEGSWSSGEKSDLIWLVGIDPYGNQTYHYE
ncbi:MAG TPA: hypothetical protein VHT27_01090 [Solirubrobacteraceae bacterium]|jgi:hypothetical protein|nr:hypothetical protein [Solirubrobacteraceae bacterium]